MLGDQPYVFTGMNIYNAATVSGWCWYAMARDNVLADTLAAMGPGNEVFRAWFFQLEATVAGQRDWSAFDRTLATARASGRKVIAVLVDYREWVQEIVIRYRDDPTILAWQLVNEAEAGTGTGGCRRTAARTLQRFAADMAALVKSIDPYHLLSLGTIGSGQCGARGTEYLTLHATEGIDLCEYHDYGRPDEPVPGDEWNGMAVRLLQCLRWPSRCSPVSWACCRARPTGPCRGGPHCATRSCAGSWRPALVGLLIWTWRDEEHGGSALDDYFVGPGDPALTVLGSF
jgi:mannan endo-1,4-beta-mannosidase